MAARQDEYRRRQMNMGGTNLAYDLSAAPARQPAPPQVQPVPAQPATQPVRQPRLVPARKPQLQPAPNRKFWLFYCALLVVGAILLGAVLSVYSEITLVSVQNSAMKSDINSLRKEQSALSLAQSQKISRAEIEKRAEELGLVRPTDESVKLLGATNAEAFELSAGDDGGTGVWSFLSAKVKEAAEAVWQFIN